MREGGAQFPATLRELYQGPSSPVWDFGVGNTFTFFDHFRLYARVEGSGDTCKPRMSLAEITATSSAWTTRC